MSKFTRRMKKTTKQYIVVSLISVATVAVVAVGISVNLIRTVQTKYDRELYECRSEMEANKRSVYITTKELLPGDVLTEECVKKEEVYATQPQDTYLDVDDIGKVVLVRIQTDTQLLDTMVTNNDIDDNLREVQYSTIRLSSNLKENDIVDVRISFPNGEDFAVLSKKTLKGYTGETTESYFWLTEKEILLMSSATVDAYLYTGAYLYTTKYVEPNLQDATLVNYEPSVETIKLIKENPNIVDLATEALSEDARKALENRLSYSMKKDVMNQHWDIKDDYMYPEINSNEDEMTQPDAVNTDTSSEEIVTPESQDITPAPSNEEQEVQPSEIYPDQGENTQSDINGLEDHTIDGADLGKYNNNEKEDKKYETEYFSTTEG